MIVLAIVGLMHAIILLRQGSRCKAFPEIYLWLLMGLGMVLEDGAQLLYAIWRSQTQLRHMNLWYYLGYVWVWLYFSWALPKGTYPNFFCG